MKNTINLKDFKCYWCKGIHLEEISEGHYKCKSCGYVNYKLSDKDNIRFENAQSYMTNFEYEKADRIYQELYNCDERLTKIQALIGRIFAYFGVAYIKDFNKKLVPTFSKYDPKYKSIKSIKYYEEIELLDREKRFIEMIDKADEEYKKIEKLLNETPEYDAFICCKNSKKTIQNPNEEGPTEDSKYAIDLHNYLNNNNKKVFYSEEDLIGIETDGQIYSAIMKSKTMILIISNNDYFYSPWVRSEWERWINLIKKGIRKENTLIVYECPSKDIKNSVLFPESFNKPQIKKDKLDVIKALNNVLKTDNTIDNLLKEAKYNLDMFEIDEAEKIYKQITHDYPNDYRGWLGLVDILIEREVSENDKRYQRWVTKALKLANEENKRIIKNNYCKESKENKLDLDEEFQKAEEKYEQELYEEAFEIYEKLATKYDHDESYFRMGLCYYNGYGIEQDYEKAIYWYEKAADQGHSGAAIQLYLIKGSLTSESFIEAIDKSIEKREEAENKAKKQIEKEISKTKESEIVNVEKKDKIIKVFKKKKTFGKYPQTQITNKILINKLKNIDNTNELGYLEYKGKEYKEYDSNYYLVEPIKWKILEESNNTYKLLSDVILDNSVFCTEDFLIKKINKNIIYENNYEYSNIRAWLNGYNGSSYNVDNYTGKGFIDIAFTEEERKIINETQVDNSALTTGIKTNNYACNNTLDKVYLLSYQDVTNKYFIKTYKRKAKLTDYAIAKGEYEYSSSNGAFWLRSPDDYYPDHAYYVSRYGDVRTSKSINSYPCVRPALEITIK